MSLIGAIIGYALSIFLLILVVRIVLDWIITLSGSPAAWALKARDLSHRWTEPVIAPVRRVLRPVRAGGLQIDLAFTVVFIAVIILREIAFAL